mmetsp:Transcript_31085/g.66179  ORF Transcript_31085/g.66179 Transcript_31085/m.66179 type:complete len:214 (-) Transcript_31085:89-730(-)
MNLSYLKTKFSMSSPGSPFGFMVRNFFGSCSCFSELPPASMMLSRIGRTASSDMRGSGEIAGLSCKPTRLTSICLRTLEPRRGSNPWPVMFTQPVNFRVSRLVAAWTQASAAPTSSSDSLPARARPTSAKSSVDHISSRSLRSPSGAGFSDRMAWHAGDGDSCRCGPSRSEKSRQEDEGAAIAAANSARDGLGRNEAATARASSGISLMWKPT